MDCLNCSRLNCKDCPDAGEAAGVCPDCSGDMEWCNVCQMYKKTCCEMEDAECICDLP